MADLQYSLEARNVLNRFHKVEKILYVEGDDDIPFWEIIINSIGSYSYKIEESGGKPQLEERMAEIESGNADFLVAIDSDFDDFNKIRKSPKIIKTFGYSIENTMISDAVLHRAVCNISKISKKIFSIEECRAWLATVNSTIGSLVYFDIKNRLDGHGVSVIGDNCDRFMTSKKSCVICDVKVGDHIANFPFEVDEESERAFSEFFRERNLNSIDMLRGHFLISLAFRFIKFNIAKLKGEISISREAFYGVLATCFEISFNKDHAHRDFYEVSINNAFN